MLVSFGVVKCFLPWDQLGFRASKIITAASELIDGLFLLFGTFLLYFLVANLAFLYVLCPGFYSIRTPILSSLALVILPVHFLMFCKQGISNLL